MVRFNRGFTFLEVMLVVAILGILLGIAAPAFSEWVASQRVRDAAGDIHSSLIRARSEAVKRSSLRNWPIAVRPVTLDGVTSWANGWYIADPDPVFNPDSANPTVFIEKHEGIPNATIEGAGAITFTGVGRLAGAAVTMKLTVTGTTSARCITVDTAGRPKIWSIRSSENCT